jgi:hypothetical protein
MKCLLIRNKFNKNNLMFSNERDTPTTEIISQLICGFHAGGGQTSNRDHFLLSNFYDFFRARIKIELANGC